jgi:hypothetical protein
MTPKERIISAIRHEEPDRVPTGENQVPGDIVERVLGRPVLYNAGWREIQAVWDGKRDEVVRDYGQVHVEITRALEWDYVRVPVVPAAKEYSQPEMTGTYSWIDGQGRAFHTNPDAGNIVMPSSYPSMTIDDLPDQNAPFEIDPTELEAIRYVVDEIGDSHFIIGRSPLDGTYPWNQTVGMEEFLIKMITEPEFVKRAVDIYVDRSIVYIKAMLDAGVDGIMTTDDYSDNRGPIMGTEMFRTFVLPGIQRQCDAIHEMGGFFIKHTDGNLWDVLDDLVEIGIDGWHGIQRNIGMDMGKLKTRYGSRLCFFGGVNAETLISGSPGDTRQEVKSAIEEAGAGGGLVLATSNVVPPGATFENYSAMRQATREFGSYPLR